MVRYHRRVPRKMRGRLEREKEAERRNERVEVRRMSQSKDAKLTNDATKT